MDGTSILNALTVARKAEVFLDSHLDHNVRFSEAEPKAYCPLCRVLWTPGVGEEPVRFNGRPDQLAA